MLSYVRFGLLCIEIGKMLVRGLHKSWAHVPIGHPAFSILHPRQPGVQIITTCFPIGAGAGLRTSMLVRCRRMKYITGVVWVRFFDSS